jgi:hypothetical protein
MRQRLLEPQAARAWGSFVGRRPEARNASGGGLSLFLLQFPRGDCTDAADLRKLAELYKKLRQRGE